MRRNFKYLYIHTLSIIFRFPPPLEHRDFKVDTAYCTGGQWILPDTDFMELFVYSTERLNLTLVHRDGDVNESRAKGILKDIQYLVENISTLNDDEICYRIM